MNTPGKRGGKARVATAPEKDAAKDLNTFEALPVKTKVLSRLQDESDKTSGPAAVTLQKKIKAAGVR